MLYAQDHDGLWVSFMMFIASQELKETLHAFVITNNIYVAVES